MEEATRENYESNQFAQLAAKAPPGDVIEEQCNLDIRKINKIIGGNNSGLEKIKKDQPKVTTLIDKVQGHGHAELLTLAGVAIKENQTVFSIIRKNIKEMHANASILNEKIKMLETQLEFLEELAVLE